MIIVRGNGKGEGNGIGGTSDDGHEALSSYAVRTCTHTFV